MNCQATNRALWIPAFVVLMFCSHAPSAEQPSPGVPGRISKNSARTGGIQLHDVTRLTGINFLHTDGSSGNRYIVETVASGLALFDYDNDGRIDIYFLNGAPLRGTKTETVPRNSLW